MCRGDAFLGDVDLPSVFRRFGGPRVCDMTTESDMVTLCTVKAGIRREGPKLV